MKKIIFTLLLSLVALCLAAEEKENPVANPDATVVCGNARFTVLTSRLIRMEWAADGVFEDRATLAIVNRNLEVPAFKVSRIGKGVTIKTDALTLKYKGPGKFSADNLSVSFKMGKKTVRWFPGADDSGNLLGTFRTLDGNKGFRKLNKNDEPFGQGILSRDGWAIVDESTRQVLQKDSSRWGEWVAERPSGDRTDWYIFAYGHQYKDALADFKKVAGRIPLPPRYVFGYWWSRYWQYSDFEFLNLAKEIRSHNIPMDIMVIDMDWHDTWTLRRKNPPKDEFGQRIGWTGYTWQKELFPNPEKTLEDLHAMNLKTSLNLHPASGIQPYEDCYEAFVKDYLSRTDNYDGPRGYVYNEGDSLLYLRSNPATRSSRTAKAGEKAPVPFRIDQQEWADAYFNSVIHPLQNQGVDFWWLDWQQWVQSEYMPGLSNTFWLNHTFFNDSKFSGNGKRPIIYHRWGGLGSHRYQIGFSGDCYDTWEVLSFLPYFTGTASNVGYGYWGHDIGGHQSSGDPWKPEIYTRWLQYGVFTPIFKTHSTKSALIERRIWTYAPEYSGPMREAVRLRYSLSPYIYTAAREAYDTGVSICRPMYYHYPEAPEAYSYKEQYMFGNDILATTICEGVDSLGLASRAMWFPEGDSWYDMATGKVYEGGSTHTLHYTLEENPWYVKAGAIIPLAGEDIMSLQEKSNVLRLLVAPGDGVSECSVYEDDGISSSYAGEFCTTKVRKEASASHCKVSVLPREGKYAGMDQFRKLEFILEGVFAPLSVTVNGKSVDWKYVGKDLALVVSLPESPASEETVLECTFPEADPSVLRGCKGVFHRMMAYTPVLKDVYNRNVDPYCLLSRPFLRLAQCASLIETNPSAALQYIEEMDTDALAAQLEEEAIAAETASRADKAAQIRKAKAEILARCRID